MKISAQGIAKKHLFFCLTDVLISGSINQKVSRAKVGKALSFLKGLEEKGLVELFLFSGRAEEKMRAKISENGLEKFFEPKRIFFITKEYIDSKEQVDKERHLANLDADHDFADEFFKQHLLKTMLEEGKIERGKTVVIGHDIWFDAFYTMRFAQVDFVLVESALSERNRSMPARIQGLNYAEVTESDMKRLVLGKYPKPDLRFLENYIFNRLKLELFQGGELDKITRLAQEKRAKG